jgi:hypothetical protein
MYCSTLVVAFVIGTLVVLSIYQKSDERLVNVQRGEESNSRKIVAQIQNNSDQDDLPALEFDELRINGIGLGTSHSTVLRQLGKPLQSRKTGVFPCGDLEKTLRYSGLIIKLEKDSESQDYKVVAIEITSNKWSVSGISVGANINDVQAKFKYRHHKTKEPGLVGLHYGNGDGGTSFYFRNNKLVSIDLEYNWC